MPRTHHAKVAMIERRELPLFKAFDDGEDCGIDVADAQIAVPGPELKDALVIVCHDVFDADHATPCLPEDFVERRGEPLLTAPVVDFHEHWRGDDQLLTSAEERRALPVSDVLAVQRCEERTRIHDERHVTLRLAGVRLRDVLVATRAFRIVVRASGRILPDERRHRMSAAAERDLKRLAHDLRDGDTALLRTFLHSTDEIVLGLNDESSHGIMISEQNVFRAPPAC